MTEVKKTNSNKTLVTVYPGGTISSLDNSNPYIMLEDQESPRTASARYESAPLASDERMMSLPEDLLQKAIQLDAIECPVRTIIMLDIIMSCLHFLNGWIGGLVCLLASTNGYLATVYYKRSLMVCYLMYQYFQVFIRLAGIIILIAEPQQYGYNHTFTEFSVNASDRYFLSLGVDLFFFFCQTTIAVFITKYYKLLPGAEARQRIRLVQHGGI